MTSDQHLACPESTELWAFAARDLTDSRLEQARSIAQLNHPGIVTVYDTVRSEEDICYLVTQFIDGESLDPRLQKVDFDFEHSVEMLQSVTAHRNQNFEWE